MTSRRTLFIALFALVAAPILAGCADNADDPGPGTTTPAGTSPATTSPVATSPAPATSVIPSLPVTPTLNLNLKLGVMMPLSGPLANLGPDMRDAALLAVEEVNAANVGLKITTQVEDDKTVDSAGAPATFDRLVNNGATAVVGPCCSGVTGAILSRAKESEVVVASPSATSPGLTAGDNEGFFWRVSPSDELQGRILARLVREDNVTKVNVIAINNPYGTGLAGVFRTTYTATAGNTIGAYETFSEAAEEFSSVVTAACAGNPQAIVIVAYIAQGGNILKEMNKQGCLARVKLYGSEGVYDGEGYLGISQAAGNTSANKNLAAGMKGTKPDSGNLSGFQQKFQAKYNHAPAQYSAESYDGVMYIALSALKAKSTQGRAMADNILAISTGGQKCGDFRTCAAFILAGQDVDYQGQAHDFDYTAKQEPTKGVYAVWTVDDAGNVQTTRRGLIAE